MILVETLKNCEKGLVSRCYEDCLFISNGFVTGFFLDHFVPFLPIAYYAITKEKEEDKNLQEIEDKFLQRKRNSPGVRYALLKFTQLITHPTPFLPFPSPFLPPPLYT